MNIIKVWLIIPEKWWHVGVYPSDRLSNAYPWHIAEGGRPVAIALDTVSRAQSSWWVFNMLLQKGPEIRTGLTRDGKDVRYPSHLSDLLWVDVFSIPLPLAMSSPFQPIQSTTRFVTVRLCGSITYVTLARARTAPINHYLLAKSPQGDGSWQTYLRWRWYVVL